jgi:PAS domain S-box-containing protein
VTTAASPAAAGSLPPRRSFLGTWAVPAVLLAFGLLLTAGATLREAHDVNVEAELRFERLVERLGTAVGTRMMQPRYGLRGAVGLFAAEDDVSVDAFRRYVDSRDLESEFRGALGFGFIERVPRADVEAFVARVHADGARDFAVRSSGDAPDLYVIRAIEPLAANRQALGYDIASEPRRRAAAEQAARTGEPTLSQSVELLQDSHHGPGFLLLLPVYTKGAPPRTPEERIERLRGFVYAPLLAERLLDGIDSEADGMVDLEIFDGTELARPTLIYDADHHLVAGTGFVRDTDYAGRRFAKSTAIEAGGRTWTLRLSSTPKFDATVDAEAPWIVATVGSVLSLLVALLAWALDRGRARAIVLAEQMTATLRASEAEARKLALVASRTDNAVIIADRAGRIEWVNEGFTRISGYRLDEVRGRTPGSFLQGPDTDPAVVAQMRECLAAGRGFNVEIVNYHRNGTPYWLAIEMQVLRDERGDPVQFMAIEADITARKQAEAQVNAAMARAQQSAAEAEQASRAKSQFLATMSHEIRTPMNGVIGMTSLLLDTGLSKQQREYVEIIRSSGEALLSVINDILDFSKIESGKLELEREVFDVRGCVESVLDVVAPAAAAKGLDLVYDVGDSVPTGVVGDAARLRQVILNLVGNAVKFTEHGEVEVSVATAVAPDGQPALAFAVRDTGIGIDAAAQQRLFESFTQVDASTTRKYGGTGLGLAISRRLVELMGGRLWIESAPGAGSTFRFTVLAPRADLPAPPFATPLPTLRGKRVLVVDDNATNRRILTTMASRWGLETVAVEGAAPALAALQPPGAFDAVITDMEMPGQDGVMLARELRRRLGERTPPVVLLSSLGRRESGADRDLFAAMLTKPARHSQVYDALVSALAVSAARQAADSAVPRAAARAPAPVEAPGAPRRSERILLVEDNAVNQKVALHMLGRLGYRADVAGNGLEALEAVERQPYDVILMDMQMPEMDGLEATRRIVARHPDRASRPWIVALTANAMKTDVDACFAAGMDDFLTKPLTMPSLQGALARLPSAAPESAPA